MYPKDKKTAAMLSEAIRDILGDDKIMEAIIANSKNKPSYWDMLPEKNGVTAIVIAQMLKAMGGDTAAFTALSRFGFGEKVQMDVSDFYRADRIQINVVNPEALNSGEENIIEGEVSGDNDNAIEANAGGNEDVAGSLAESSS